MREITSIIVHCSATRPDMDIGVDEIRKWHTDPKPKGRGWSDIGYHYVIRRDGQIETGRPLQRPGAHAYGHNAHSIGVCLVGGVDGKGQPRKNFTPSQLRALRGHIQYHYDNYSSITTVLGHRDLPGVRKACPCFDVRTWLWRGL